jgi:hypothetical protein
VEEGIFEEALVDEVEVEEEDDDEEVGLFCHSGRR